MGTRKKRKPHRMYLDDELMQIYRAVHHAAVRSDAAAKVARKLARTQGSVLNAYYRMVNYSDNSLYKRLDALLANEETANSPVAKAVTSPKTKEMPKAFPTLTLPVSNGLTIKVDGSFTSVEVRNGMLCIYRVSVFRTLGEALMYDLGKITPSGLTFF